MAEENKKERRRWERMKDTYRLVIFNNETFEEVELDFNLSPLNVYVMLSTMVVLVSGLAIAAIVFTPIKRLIPGYGTTSTHPEMVKIYRDIDSLEQLAIAQDRYNQGIKKLLTADVQYAPKEPPEKKSVEGTHEPVERSDEDAKLRNEVEMADIRAVTGSAVANPVNISPREIPLEQMHFATPIGGSIVASFDPDKRHLGVDIIAPKNTPVKAAMDGWVISSDWTLETGNTIAIQHTNNIVTFYKHNSVLLKTTGSYVRGGEAIAIIGNTGELTDGPHLHFELWHEGKPMNPTDFVDFK